MQPWDILPSVKKATPAEGAVVLDGKVALAYPDAYAVEARLLKEKLSALYGLEVVDKAPVTIAFGNLADKAKAVNDEYYDMVYRQRPDKD